MSLEALRRKAQLTQSALEELSGVKQATISKIERGGTVEPTISTLSALVSAFSKVGVDTSFEQILKGCKENNAA